MLAKPYMVVGVNEDGDHFILDVPQESLRLHMNREQAENLMASLDDALAITEDRWSSLQKDKQEKGGADAD